MYFFSHCHRKTVIKLFETYIEATITAIIIIAVMVASMYVSNNFFLEFFPHTSRDSKKR